MRNTLIIFFSILTLSSCRQPQTKKDTEFVNSSKITSIELDEQNIEDLKTLGLIWGYLKYYHPSISAGIYNWDFELFRIMPKILKAKDIKERDGILYQWIVSLGEFEQIEKERDIGDIKLEPDLKWIENSEFSIDLKSILSILKDAKRTGKNHYVSLTSGVNNPDFRNEDAYSDMKYPDAGYRLLSLYRYWNIVQYYFPYKNLIEEDWKDVLSEFIPRFIRAGNETEYQLAVLELMARVHDTHANFVDGKLFKYWGINQPAFAIEFIKNKAIVSAYIHSELSKNIGLKIGDEITMINGTSVSEIVQDQLKYTPASNYPTQLRDISKRLLRTNDSTLTIEYRTGEEFRTETIKTYIVSKFYDYYNESKNRTSFKLINEDIAYLYLGSIKNSDLSNVFNEIKKTKGLIIDLRCYPSEFVVFTLSKHLLPKRTEFVRFSTGSIEEAGLFTFTKSLEVGQKNKDYYKGKVVILINETTQSQAEYTTMALRVAPKATVIGSTTAGADGNVSTFYLPGNIRTMISGIGIYYPDKTETQRIGIVPDIEIKPTIEGIKNNKDKLLEKAIELIEE